MFWVLGQVQFHVLIVELHERIGSWGPGHFQVCWWHAHQVARPVMQTGQKQTHALWNAPLPEALL